MESTKTFLLTITLILLVSSMPIGVLAEEPSLQQWLTDNTYLINVTTNETGAETFPAGHYRAAMSAEFALFAPNNTFGWYLLATGALQPIFSGENAPSSTAEFSPAESFGLYIVSPEGTFYTEKSRNPDGFDHVWVFQDPKTEDGCIVTWEDMWNGGDKDYQDMTIALRLLRPPHAAFDWFPQNPQVKETVTFNGSTSTPNGGTIVSHKWDFGDGSPFDYGPVVTHYYTTPGNYTVMLNVTDTDAKWDTESKTIQVQKLQTEFAVKIEDMWTWPENEYTFKGPAYCNTFEVKVWIANVSDLFGYTFQLEFDPSLIQLTQHEISHIHTEDLIVSEEADNTRGTYRQTVTAKGGAEPYDGSAPVVSLSFHIIKDPCYPYNYTTVLRLTNTNMTDSQALPIDHSNRHGYFTIFSVGPEISIDCDGKTEITNWIADKTFTVDIVLTDIVKMKGLYLELGWCDCLETNYQSVDVTDFLLPPYEIYKMSLNLTMLSVQIKIPDESPAINGTGTILRVTFTARNPWGDVPPYSFMDGKYLPVNCTCRIWIIGGWIDVYCPEYRRMEFYNPGYGVNVKTRCSYAMTPIPGDLNLDGIVDISDSSAIARWVGYDSGDPEWTECQGFDLNSDNRVDLFDVVIVAANFGRTHP